MIRTRLAFAIALSIAGVGATSYANAAVKPSGSEQSIVSTAAPTVGQPTVEQVRVVRHRRVVRRHYRRRYVYHRYYYPRYRRYHRIWVPLPFGL
jgi:hypothetical protein